MVPMTSRHRWWVGLLGLGFGLQLAALYLPAARPAGPHRDLPARADTAPASSAPATFLTALRTNASTLRDTVHTNVHALARVLPAHTDKVVHAGIFATTTALAVVLWRPVAAIGIQTGHALTSERLQGRLPGRTADAGDTVADLTGVAIGAGVGFLVRWARR